MSCDRDIRMSNYSGWDQGRSARGELDHRFAVPHDEVAAFLGVIVAEGCDGAKAERKVGAVKVWHGSNLRTQVVCSSSKGAVERLLQSRVLVKEFTKPFVVIAVQFWSAGLKYTLR